MTNTLSNISVAQLKRAVTIREQIEGLQAELSAILDGGSVAPVVAEPAVPGKRRTMSASARAKIAAAQRLRWAKAKGGSTAAAAPAVPGKRTMSASARAKIAAAQRLRWAKVKKTEGPAVASGKPVRKMSAAARAKISAAAKARWAKAHAAGRKSL